MEILRAYKVELDPNNVQRTALLKHAGAARFAFNWGLARRKQEYEETGKSSNAIEQHRQLNALKPTEFPWMYEVSKCVMQEALRDLDKAYQNFFRRVKAGEKPGFPKFKSRKSGVGSFRLTGAIRVENSRIRLPRIGWLRLKEHGYIPTEGIHILSATVTESAGRWFVSVQCKREIESAQAMGEPVGVDLGIKNLAVTSDGQRFENPKPLKKAQAKLRRLQRELSRRKKGGKNREKTRQKIAKVHQRITNIRRDALHKVTSAIVAKTKPDNERPSVIVLEDLNVSGMLANHCLAQAINDVGFAEFRRQVKYKSLWYGSELLLADRFFPSSRICRYCGCINSELKLSDREWTCDCGAVLDRDLNAAINLKNLAINLP
ncbi:MAG TPA: transposase [Bacteroidales bacterium]|nr:transposase [Bacteroidales bacterium]